LTCSSLSYGKFSLLPYPTTSNFSRNEDVSETMYKETLKSKDLATKAHQTPSSISTKVNRICDAFLTHLSQPTHASTHLQNIITAHVSKVPADLEAGLKMIGRLQAASSPLVEKAAEHICFLADVNQLYDTALGIYNLELALLIAQQSQKDPREYLPHLQSLHDQPDLRRKFSIDDQLGRHTKALGHLKDLHAFEEAQAYVQKHVLYSAALQLYQYNTTELNTITRLYADHLSVTNSHAEAALAYDYLNDHASAYPHYASALLWREALSSCTLAGVDATGIRSLAENLADTLTESKDYLSASTLHLEYLDDLSGAAKLLCKGNFFSEAIRIVTLRRAPALLETFIDPALIERSGETTEFLADMKTQLAAQVPRLLELRQRKKEDPFAFYEMEESNNPADSNIPDNISLAPTETTSGGTFMTRYTSHSQTTLNTTTTRKTSKKKRQEERKRARGKKGTVYEEEYLANSIERLIERVNGMEGELERLVSGLVRRGMRERASAVQGAVEGVVERCREAVGKIYVKDEEEVGAGGAGVGGGVGVGMGLGVDGREEVKPVGADATLWASIDEVNRKREAPVVKGFERLSLLG
jgi:elongator complex protein 1